MKLSRFVRPLLTSLITVLVLGVLPVKGQMKIGYMNPQTVLDTLPAKEQVEQQLNSIIAKKRKQLEQQTVTFQKRITQLQRQAQNATESRRQALQDSANALNQRLQQYRRKVQQQIQRRRAKLLRPIYNRIDKAIQTVAERNSLEFVLNEKTGKGQNIIYYANANQKDITDEVIDELLSNSNNN